MLWDLAGQMVAKFIDFVLVGWLPVASSDPFAALASSDPSAWVGSMEFAALFVDLPFLFVCLGLLFVWKAIWLLYRIWRIILQAIPMAG